MAVKDCTGVVAILVLLAAISLRGTQALGTNEPRELEAFNTSVVEATVKQLNQLTEINAQLQADNRFIRRIAWVETADGTAPGTFSDPTYHGGIWRVDESIFDITKGMYNDPFYASIFTDIERELCINWGMTTWNDCRRPLHSALAARLYFHSIDRSIPNGVENQAIKWKAGYNSRPSDTEESFVMKVSDLEKTGCDTSGIDLIFVLDGSGSVTSTGFITTKTFVLGMVDFFNIGANDVRVGVIQYSTSPRTEFHLNRYTDKDSLKQAISNIAYLGGNTATGLAIDTMVANFSPENGARPSRGIPRVGVVITDGKSQDNVTGPANAAREMDIIIFAIGVTSADKNELNAIANKPNDTYVFHVENFNAISSIGATLQYATCDRSEPVFNETIINTISRGQRQNFQVGVPNEGVTIILNANSGRTVMFVSFTTPVPNKSHYDKKVDAMKGTTIEIYIGPGDFTNKCDDIADNNGRKKRQAGTQETPDADATIGTVYMTIEGLEETNNFVLMVTEGDVTTPTTESASTRMTTESATTRMTTLAMSTMTTSGCDSVTSTAALTIAGCCTLINRLFPGALYK